ncbi:MAG: twin-arginine translocase TatA/TatE family subunit [Actinobacteria bacterium]|nr:twin-arginine translocase TatA/TatE family subunit [Actinomycetota bacterium]NCU80395.1 twin-arginine translocase TatA/TatE family subunit [Acidimicrobiia bacterium]NBP41472.1 twin-arginine translocase TatA/TatE family subunit [Actinomycetota bacterium]NCW83139.1 twin-arginine translocase TatA/TatE family subunit [Acidimicrobiia bacterium]NDA36930.1 twin-arginine translocase TatA/TatE family subunit [Acidimicrobiia bacterium]
MFNLTGSEIMFLLIIGLVVLGPEKLPDAIRRLGRLYSELKRMSSGVQTDFRKVMDEPLKEMINTTNSMKALFNDTSSQFQAAARDLVEPTYIPYGQADETTPGQEILLRDGDASENAVNESKDDNEIADAIERAALIARERVEKQRAEDEQSMNALDDVS